MLHPPEAQRTDVVQPTQAQLDRAVGSLARYLYEVGATEGSCRAMVYETVYEKFRHARPDQHKVLDDFVLATAGIENIGSTIIAKEFAHHLISFRKGTRFDTDLGATRSVLLVESKIADIPLP